jgi:hypothetical protein
LGGLAEVGEDTVNGTHLGPEGDDPHRLAAAGADEREDLHPRRWKQAHPLGLAFIDMSEQQ